MTSSGTASSPTVSYIVGVEVVLLTVDDRTLLVALTDGGLPNDAVGATEALDAAARRILREVVGIDAPVRQVQAFDRDLDKASGRVVGVAYTALLPLAALRSMVGERLSLVELREGIARGDDGAKYPLPEGQSEVIAFALADLRAHLDTTNWAYGLLPEGFTLRALQHTHEATTGREFHRMAFRKRLLDSGWLEPTGRRESGTTYRPAELYRLKPERARER